VQPIKVSDGRTRAWRRAPLHRSPLGRAALREGVAGEGFESTTSNKLGNFKSSFKKEDFVTSWPWRRSRELRDEPVDVSSRVRAQAFGEAAARGAFVASGRLRLCACPLRAGCYHRLTRCRSQRKLQPAKQHVPTVWALLPPITNFLKAL